MVTKKIKCKVHARVVGAMSRINGIEIEHDNIEIIIGKDGSIESEKYNTVLDEILAENGVPITDVRRNPFC